MKTQETKIKRNPITWVPSAYFAMGLPFVVLNMVTVLMFNGLGVDDKLVTFWTSLILLPYTLKPLWSPFLELFRTKKFWVVTTQFVTGITFGGVAFSLGLPNFFVIAITLLGIIGFSGATHDIACDGVYMSELDEKQQAAYIGWQGAFYNIAKIVALGRSNGGTFSEKQIYHIQTYKECVGGWGTGFRRGRCVFCNNHSTRSYGRQDPRTQSRLLQP